MAVKNQTIDMGTGSVKKLLLKMAVPTVIAQLISLIYNIVDRIYIGHIEGIGTLALTGVGLCAPLILLINAFASLGGAGGAPRAAIAMGQGKNEQAEKILGNCFAILMVFAVILTGVLFFAAEPLLVLFGASENTLPFALDYMRIYVFGSVAVLTVMGMNPFLTTQGFTKFAMISTVIGAGINIILDPIFIFGLKMGVKGAALATIISQAVSAIWILSFLRGKKTILKLRVPNIKLSAKVILPCLALGASPFVMLMTESLLNISFNTSLVKYGGDIAVGSMTILSSVNQLALLPLSGICQGGQPIISYNYGAGNKERVKEAFKLQFSICFGYTVIFWAVCMLFPQMFANIFTNDMALVEYTSWALRIYGAGILVLGMQISCQQSFMALGQAKTSLLLACLRKMILLIPLIFILPIFFENKVFAVFLAEPVSDIIASLVTATVFFKSFNKILDNGSSTV